MQEKQVRSQFVAVVARPNKPLNNTDHKYNRALSNLIPKNVIAIKQIPAKCIFLFRRSRKHSTRKKEKNWVKLIYSSCLAELACYLDI